MILILSPIIIPAPFTASISTYPVVPAVTDPVVTAVADPVVPAVADLAIPITDDRDRVALVVHLDHSYGPIGAPDTVVDEKDQPLQKRARMDEDLVGDNKLNRYDSTAPFLLLMSAKGGV